MGKMKISKKQNNRKPGTVPTWLLITVISIILLTALAICSVSIISSTGIATRLLPAMESKDYKVSGNMMKYYYVNTYSNYYESYSTYWNYFSIGAAESIEDHNDILFGGTAESPNTYDTMFFGEFDGTWYDYFMSQTRDSVKSMLVYCEEADELGITLTEEEIADIDNSIDTAILNFEYQQLVAYGVTGLSENACLSSMYGSGIRRSDIRQAMELSTLASKCQQAIYDEIESGITDDRIVKMYEENKIDFDIVDYFYFDFSAKYTEDNGEEKYKEAIAAAKAAAAELASKTTLDEFKAYVYDYVAKEGYDTAFDEEKPASASLPTEEQLKVIKENIIKNVVAEVIAGKTAVESDVVKTEADGKKTYKMYEIDITEEFANAIKDVESILFSNVSSVGSSYAQEGATYTKDDELSEWLFATDRVAGNIKTIQSGDGANSDTVKVDAKSFNAKVVIVTKARYRDETNAKDVAYMMFENSNDAKEAIKKLDAITTLNKEEFEKVAKESDAAANTVYEDYMKGDMQSTSFDNWLYDKETKIGSYTASPLTMSDSSSMVAYYVGDGDVAWKVTVKNTLINDDFTARDDQMATKHAADITETPWVIGILIK